MAIHCITSGRLFRKRAKGVGINSGIGCCFTGFTCHPVDAPAHDCNHNYVARNRHAASSHISRDNWLCSGFLHRFHITTLDPEHSGSTRLFCLKPSRFQNIHPTKAYHRKKGEHQMMSVYGKASARKNEPVHYPAGLKMQSTTPCQLDQCRQRRRNGEIPRRAPCIFVEQ